MAMRKVKLPTTLESTASHAFAITPDDSLEVNPDGIAPVAIRIGATGGALTGALVGDKGVDQLYFVLAGETVPLQFEFIRATGTDATGILGVY